MAFSHEQKRKIKSLGFYFILLVFMELVLRDKAFQRSLELISWLQTNWKGFIPVEQVFHYFGTDKFLAFFIFLVYNFMNIYKTFILLTIISICSFLTGFLKMIYTHPRPYWVNIDILPYQCEAGWGNPSGHALVTVPLYLGFWNLLFSCKELKEKIIYKKIGLGIIVVFTGLICFSRIILGLHGVDQVLYGVLIGLGVYYFIFNILELNPNDPNEVFSIISIEPIVLIFSQMGLLMLSLTNYFGVSQTTSNEGVFNRIIEQKNCGYLGMCKRFENDSLLNCIVIHYAWVAILGMKVEYYYIYNFNIKNWAKNNFSHFAEGGEGAEVPFLHSDDISDTRDYQWNHTFGLKTILRLLLSSVFILIIFIPYFLISCDDSMILVVTLKIMAPCCLSIFLMFSYLKRVLRFFNVTNQLHYQPISININS